jgi:H+/Cl- antiporter ClcA
MQAVAIVALCIASAVIYGILHDQVTARVCVEYFTIGHPPVFDTNSPTLLGLGWGIIATWWVGLLLGVPLAIAARAGHRPKKDVRSLIRPICKLLILMGVCALAAGIIGFLMARGGHLYLDEPLASRIPATSLARFQADWWAHLTSYFVGFIGGLVVIALNWQSRRPKLASRA